MAVVMNNNGTVAYATGVQAALLTGIDTPQKPSRPKPEKVEDGFGDISVWGEDNLFPQHVVDDYEPNTIIPQTLERQSRMLQSGGLMYGFPEGYDADGNEIFKPIRDEKVELWLKRTNINRYLREASLSFYWFYNTFPELILSKDRKTITHIYSKRPEFCRWSKTLGPIGFSKYCYMNAHWSDQTSEKGKDTLKISVLDPHFEPHYFLNQGRDYKYIYPVSYPTPDKFFYQLAPHNSVRTSGWLDVAKSIPAFKKSLFKNQVTVKYMIKISTWWWEWAYPGFGKLPQPQKQDIMQEEIENFEKFMTGPDKAGNSIITTYQSDPQLQKQYGGWEIIPIDNKLKDGIYIEDSLEASSHLIYALGLDHALLGTIPSGDMGAGSGSDKRVAYNIYIAMIEPHRDVIAEPIQFAFDHNGWPYKVKFRNTKILTLNEGTDTKTQPA